MDENLLENLFMEYLVQLFDTLVEKAYHKLSFIRDN